MYYDAHTHLNDDKLYPERKTYLDNFIHAEWKWLVNVWVDHAHNERAIKIAREAVDHGNSCRVKATIWYHPSEICFGNITQENIDERISVLRKLYDENKDYIIAIGECGIDTHYPDGSNNIELQKELFRKQCEFAQELWLPIIIHSRDDFASTFEVIKDFKDEKIYFHCYGYGAEEIKILHESFPNLRVWFCGNVTYPKAQPLRDALLACDISNIVFETDAPYLSPQKIRWERNEPANVKYIYVFSAPLLHLTETQLQHQIEKNVEKLYNL